MTLTINEKKALYAFGCLNREATVRRLNLLAALTPEPAVKILFHRLAVKLDTEGADLWYHCFFPALRAEITDYIRAETTMRLAETRTAGMEDYLDEAVKV